MKSFALLSVVVGMFAVPAVASAGQTTFLNGTIISNIPAKDLPAFKAKVGDVLNNTADNTLVDAATFVTGSITIGQNQQGAILLHCHSGFIDQHGTAHGGHLLLDTVEVGDDPLIIHFSLFSECAYIVNSDEETQFSLLHPTPMESL